MKRFIPTLIFGCLIIIIILQGVSFASTGLQYQHLREQLSEISKKIDALQLVSDTTQSSITKLRNEIIVSDAKQLGRDQILALSQTGPDNLLSPANLAKTLSPQTAPIPTGGPIDVGANTRVRLKPGWNIVDVFENTKTSSRILGQIQSSKDYAVVTKQEGWYQIVLDPQTNAWVQTQFVNETN